MHLTCLPSSSSPPIREGKCKRLDLEEYESEKEGELYITACIQCEQSSCATSFHAECALRERLDMAFVEKKGEVKMVAYCGRHTRKKMRQIIKARKRQQNRSVSPPPPRLGSTTQSSRRKKLKESNVKRDVENEDVINAKSKQEKKQKQTGSSKRGTAKQSRSGSSASGSVSTEPQGTKKQKRASRKEEEEEEVEEEQGEKGEADEKSEGDLKTVSIHDPSLLTCMCVKCGFIVSFEAPSAPETIILRRCGVCKAILSPKDPSEFGAMGIETMKRKISSSSLSSLTVNGEPQVIDVTSPCAKGVSATPNGISGVEKEWVPSSHPQTPLPRSMSLGEPPVLSVDLSTGSPPSTGNVEPAPSPPHTAPPPVGAQGIASTPTSADSAVVERPKFEVHKVGSMSSISGSSRKPSTDSVASSSSSIVKDDNSEMDVEVDGTRSKSQGKGLKRSKGKKKKKSKREDNDDDEGEEEEEEAGDGEDDGEDDEEEDEEVVKEKRRRDDSIEFLGQNIRNLKNLWTAIDSFYIFPSQEQVDWLSKKSSPEYLESILNTYTHIPPRGDVVATLGPRPERTKMEEEVPSKEEELTYVEAEAASVVDEKEKETSAMDVEASTEEGGKEEEKVSGVKEEKTENEENEEKKKESDDDQNTLRGRFCVEIPPLSEEFDLEIDTDVVRRLGGQSSPDTTPFTVFRADLSLTKGEGDGETPVSSSSSSASSSSPSHPQLPSWTLPHIHIEGGCCGDSVDYTDPSHDNDAFDEIGAELLYLQSHLKSIIGGNAETCKKLRAAVLKYMEDHPGVHLSTEGNPYVVGATPAEDEAVLTEYVKREDMKLMKQRRAEKKKRDEERRRVLEELEQSQKLRDTAVEEGEKEIICAVCGDGDIQDNNEIVLCDCCDVAVHQLCYGVDEIPEGDIPWYCRRCDEGDFHAKCTVCHQRNGALTYASVPRKKDSSSRVWCHVLCGLFVSELYFTSETSMDEVAGIEDVMKARRTLLCCLCKEKGGACIQCDKDNCTRSFHPQCAREQGYELRYVPHATSENGIRFIVRCERHRIEAPKYELRSYYHPYNLQVSISRAPAHIREREQRGRRGVGRPKKVKNVDMAIVVDTDRNETMREDGDDGEYIDSSKKKKKKKKPSKPRKRCTICLRTSPVKSGGDKLIDCSQCLKTFHPSCYGVRSRILKKKEMHFWRCSSCEDSMQGKEMLCSLCQLSETNTGDSSVLIPTTSFGYVHAVCANAIPEVLVDNRRSLSNNFQPLAAMEDVHPARRRVPCVLCIADPKKKEAYRSRMQGGTCVQCSDPNCTVSFHPICALHEVSKGLKHRSSPLGLPVGWKQVECKKTGQPYYWDTVSNTTTWERPMYTLDVMDCSPPKEISEESSSTDVKAQGTLSSWIKNPSSAAPPPPLAGGSETSLAMISEKEAEMKVEGKGEAAQIAVATPRKKSKKEKRDKHITPLLRFFCPKHKRNQKLTVRKEDRLIVSVNSVLDPNRSHKGDIAEASTSLPSSSPSPSPSTNAMEVEVTEEKSMVGAAVSSEADSSTPCNTTSSSAMDIEETSTNAVTGGEKEKKKNKSKKKKEITTWNCELCTFVNADVSLLCVMCEADRPVSTINLPADASSTEVDMREEGKKGKNEETDGENNTEKEEEEKKEAKSANPTSTSTSTSSSSSSSSSALAATAEKPSSLVGPLLVPTPSSRSTHSAQCYSQLASLPSLSLRQYYFLMLQKMISSANQYEEVSSKPPLVPEDAEVFCWCRSAYEEEEFMVECDNCHEWYHGFCTGLREVEKDRLPSTWYCQMCVKLENISETVDLNLYIPDEDLSLSLSSPSLSASSSPLPATEGRPASRKNVSFKRKLATSTSSSSSSDELKRTKTDGD